MKKALLWVATFVVAFLTYIGTMTILGTTIMHNDWRVFFISLIPMCFVLGFGYIKTERSDNK